MSHRNKEKELIHELLRESASEEFRADTLERTLTYARGRRHSREVLRTVRRSAAVLLLAAGLFFIFHRAPVVDTQNRLEAAVDPPAKPSTIKGTNIQILSDEELFALFPNRPLAMIKSSDEPRFVFLDELE